MAMFDARQSTGGLVHHQVWWISS